MRADYEQGRIVHVLADHAVLERAPWRFPLRMPFDLVDAAYWSWFDLRGADVNLAELYRRPLEMTVRMG